MRYCSAMFKTSGKPPSVKYLRKTIFDHGPQLASRAKIALQGDTLSAKRLRETAREDLRGYRSSSQARGDFLTQQLGRKTCQANLNIFRIQKTPYEFFPVVGVLNFIEKEVAQPVFIFRVATIEYFGNQCQVFRFQRQETFVLQVEIQHRFLGDPFFQKFRHALEKKPCFAGPSHADYRVGFPG